MQLCTGHRRTGWRSTILFAVVAAMGFAGVVTIAPAADAGLEIVAETRPGRDPKMPPEKRQIWVDGTNLRMAASTPPKRGQEGYVIFRGDRDLLWAVNDESKSYSQLDKETVARMGESLSNASREMDKQIANMPPEQQKKYRELMAQLNPSAGANPSAEDAMKRGELEVKATEDKREIGGKPATRIEVRRGGVHVGDVWVTPWKKAGVESGQFAAFRKFAAFHRALVDSVGTMAVRYQGDGFDVFDKIDGFPIVIERIENGKLVSHTRFRDPKSFAPEEGFFDPPKGYKLVTARSAEKGDSKKKKPGTTP